MNSGYHRPPKVAMVRRHLPSPLTTVQPGGAGESAILSQFPVPFAAENGAKKSGRFYQPDPNPHGGAVRASSVVLVAGTPRCIRAGAVLLCGILFSGDSFSCPARPAVPHLLPCSSSEFIRADIELEGQPNSRSVFGEAGPPPGRGYDSLFRVTFGVAPESRARLPPAGWRAAGVRWTPAKLPTSPLCAACALATGNGYRALAECKVRKVWRDIRGYQRTTAEVWESFGKYENCSGSGRVRERNTGRSWEHCGVWRNRRRWTLERRRTFPEGGRALLRTRPLLLDVR